jgi:hypothetical protein
VGEFRGDGARDDWDSALNRLLEGVNLDDLHIPLSSESARARLTFSTVHAHVADQLREKIRSERIHREAIANVRRQFEECSTVIDEALASFRTTLLDAFHGGGEIHRLPDSREVRSRTWQVLAHRAPLRSDVREVVVTVTLGMRGLDALDRGQPSLECRAGTPRNPRLVDFVPASEMRADVEDAICRAYQDVLGTLRFDPGAFGHTSAQTG